MQNKQDKKRVIITGVTGQDGSYLAELLLSKGYEVHGLRRRSTVENTKNLSKIDLQPNTRNNFHLHYGDVLDSSNLSHLISDIKPHEFYNLAAQSHVHLSFKIPEYTTEVNSIAVLKMLEILKSKSINTKFYQASTSEMFGDLQTNKIISEKTNFNPCSPYANSKLFSHNLIKDYRSRGIYAVSGILFNHESPRRSSNFVTMKIIDGAIKLKFNLIKCLYLGNIYSYRDWGYAPDYVDAMWRMINKKTKTKDFIIATGKSYMVKEFINKVFNSLGCKLSWTGRGLKEEAIDSKTNKVLIKIDPYYFRPNEVRYLKGSSYKAEKELSWKPMHQLNFLIKDMINSRLEELGLTL